MITPPHPPPVVVDASPRQSYCAIHPYTSPFTTQIKPQSKHSTCTTIQAVNFFVVVLGINSTSTLPSYFPTKMKIDTPKPSSLDKEPPPPYENPNDLRTPPQSYNHHSKSCDNTSTESFDVDVESAPPKSNVIPPRRSTAHGKSCCCWVW